MLKAFFERHPLPGVAWALIASSSLLWMSYDSSVRGFGAYFVYAPLIGAIISAALAVLELRRWSSRRR